MALNLLSTSSMQSSLSALSPTSAISQAALTPTAAPTLGTSSAAFDTGGSPNIYSLMSTILSMLSSIIGSMSGQSPLSNSLGAPTAAGTGAPGLSGGLAATPTATGTSLPPTTGIGLLPDTGMEGLGTSTLGTTPTTTGTTLPTTATTADTTMTTPLANCPTTAPAAQLPATDTIAAPAAQSNLQATQGTAPLNIFTQDDYKNFLLAGSKGGTTGTAESINSKFADPNSRFARTGNAQFQGAIAGMYSNQFKAYALGLDAAYTPGKNINQLSANLVQAQNVQMTPEAEVLSKVAATYRGNLTGVNYYNNAALKQLLVQWGRTDIASQPNVGSPNGDVQSIGGVVKALNEQPNPAIRQAWLQQIFDFAGNTPSSPSGAVPDLPQYQQAINIVRGGTMDQLLNSYLAT